MVAPRFIISRLATIFCSVRPQGRKLAWRAHQKRRFKRSLLINASVLQQWSRTHEKQINSPETAGKTELSSCRSDSSTATPLRFPSPIPAPAYHSNQAKTNPQLHSVRSATSATKTGTSASFVYDPNLRQIQKTVGSTKTKYVYSGSHMMQEWNGTANTLTTRYVYAGAEEPVLQMNSSGTVTYIHHDHHGSVIAQSGSSGAVGNKYKYGHFGESATLAGTTIGYTGQRFDSETGLYHYKARYYLPTIGRFLQAYHIGYAAGMNLYAYCGNDGMNRTDPMGLEDSGAKSSGIFDQGLSNIHKAGILLTQYHDEHAIDWLAKSHSQFENALSAAAIVPAGALLNELGYLIQIQNIELSTEVWLKEREKAFKLVMD